MSIGLVEFYICDIERENGSPLSVMLYADLQQGLPYLDLTARGTRGALQSLIATRLGRLVCQLPVLTVMCVPVI